MLHGMYLKYTIRFFLAAFLLFPFSFLSAENHSSENPDSVNHNTDNSSDNKSSIEIYINSSVLDKKYSLADVRAIFAMRKTRWNNGKRIQVFVFPDANPLHRQFTKSKLNMFPHQFRRIWDRLIFSGTGQAPKEVASMEDMKHMIAITPGAIGYLIKSNGNQDIRILNYE